MSYILEQSILLPAYLLQTPKCKHLLVISLGLFSFSREIFFYLFVGLRLECQYRSDSGALELNGRRVLGVSQFIRRLSPPEFSRTPYPSPYIHLASPRPEPLISHGSEGDSHLATQNEAEDSEVYLLLT